MRAILSLAAMLSIGANPVDPEVLRARAALALAFASPKASYAESYKKASVEGKPLIVFVGQPAKDVAGCVYVRVEAFPECEGPAVIIGVPSAAGLRRVDLPGKPTVESIQRLLPAGRCDGTTNCGKP